MKEFTIDACKWYVNPEQTAEFKARALDSFRVRWTPLLKFLNEQALIQNRELTKDVSDWLAFQIKSSDLTDLGFELFKKCHDKWLKGTDRGTNPENINRWVKELEKLRAQHATGN